VRFYLDHLDHLDHLRRYEACRWTTLRRQVDHLDRHARGGPPTGFASSQVTTHGPGGPPKNALRAVYAGSALGCPGRAGPQAVTESSKNE
jgi:hypothetical protein